MDTKRGRTIHVCSIIPGLSEELKQKLPIGVEVVDVTVGDEEPGKSMGEKLLWKVNEKQIEQLKEAEILLVEGRTLPQLVEHLPKLQWVQITVTGVDRLFRQMADLPKPKFLVTRNIGRSISQLIAEYIIGQIISHERSWQQAYLNQVNRIYNRGDEFSLCRSLQQLTVGIMGLGSMALEVAKTLHFFQSRVIGFGRTRRPENPITPYLDHCWYAEELQPFLEDCDYVINVLPSTPATCNLLGNDTFKYAKKKPVFINVGRGDIISEKDLLKALDQHWISAAVLDVTEKEPLPKESPLWGHPRIKITPHVSGFGSIADRISSIIESFLQNHKKFITGDQLVGTVDWEAGY